MVEHLTGEERVAGQGQRLLQRYMPALDVLRGTAILMVMLDHGLYWAGAVERTTGFARQVAKASAAGWLGVNLFFVLSGFLITGILSDSRGNPDYFQRFYLRRALRILPAYLLTIVVLLALRRVPQGALMCYLLFLVNYSDWFTGPAAVVYGVFWTLSVEEQFYLVWPTLVRRVSRRGLACICVALLVVEPTLRALTQNGRLPLGNVHINTLLIADNLACGALAALYVRSRFGLSRFGFPVSLSLIVSGVLAEIAGAPWGIAHRENAFGAAFQIVPWDIIFTGVLLFMLSLPAKWFATAWSKPLRFLGYISYGLYLCHLLIFNFYDRWLVDSATGALRAVLAEDYVRLLLGGGLAVLVAWGSRRYFEEPFLRVRVGAGRRKLLRQTA